MKNLIKFNKSFMRTRFHPGMQFIISFRTPKLPVGGGTYI